MFAIKINKNPINISLNAFFGFMSTVSISSISNKYAEAAVHAGMKFNVILFIEKELELINIGER